MLLIKIKLRNNIFEICLRARDTRKSRRKKHREKLEKNKQLTEFKLSAIYKYVYAKITLLKNQPDFCVLLKIRDF